MPKISERLAVAMKHQGAVQATECPASLDQREHLTAEPDRTRDAYRASYRFVDWEWAKACFTGFDELALKCIFADG